MSLATSFGVVWGTGVLAAIILTPMTRRLATRWGIMDLPGEPRRVHRHPVPRLGGLALYASFLLAVAVSLFLPIARQDPNESTRLTGLIIGSTLAVLIGLWG